MRLDLGCKNFTCALSAVTTLSPYDARLVLVRSPACEGKPVSWTSGASCDRWHVRPVAACVRREQQKRTSISKTRCRVIRSWKIIMSLGDSTADSFF